MNALRDHWRKLSGRFDGLAVRERALVVIATLVGTALVYDALALRPLETQMKRLEQQVAESRKNVKNAEALVKVQEAAADPGAVKRTYRDALRKQLAEIDQGMQGLQRGLVPPERMAKLLEAMLGNRRALQLVSLRTLPPQRFDAPGAAPAPKAQDKGARPASPERAIYQHSFELVLQGSYTDLHEYLSQLEKMQWQMFWGHINVNSEQYPRLRVALVVRTLSLSKAWLVV